MEIKKFEGNNYDRIYDLWNETLGDLWPVEKEQMESRINKGVSLIAVSENKVIGFINMQYSNVKGQITLIMVDKDHQRKGVGRELLDEAKRLLNGKGTKELLVGCGAGSYFWPGTPTNLPAAVSFFKKNGLETDEVNLDMVGNLENYQTPKEVVEKVSGLNLQFKLLADDDKKELIEFEKENFSDWVRYFEDSQNENIFIVKLNNKIVGSVLLFGKEGFVWNKLLDGAGGFGALGVAESCRGKGIGLALAAKATEILRQRGVKSSFLGWTYLDKWYGKLGYEVWRKYEHGKVK